MADYTLTIIVKGVDQTAPAQQGVERLGVGGVAVGNILADVAMKAGAALAGLASSSVTAAADFQNATATFASVAGGALAQAGFTLDDVANKALEMGAVTAFSAAEAQQAMIELAKGGVPVVDVMGQATQATLDLAAAGEVGLATSAEIVAKQLGVWASTGVTAADVSNTLAQAANASTVGVEELALGLSAVGGVAQVSGVSFEDLNQTLAMIIPGFSSASDAGTSFKTMLLSMQGKSKEAVGVMQELGIITTDYAAIAGDLGITWDGSGKSMAALNQAIYDNVVANSGATAGTKAFDEAMSAFMNDFQVNTFYDANGALKDMDDISQILQNSLAGLSEEQKTAALNTMFGTDAYRAAAFIAKAGAEGFNAMGTAMANAGTAAEQAAIRQQTFKFAWDSLIGTLETIQIVIGGALLPLLTMLVNNALIPAGNAILIFAQGIISAADPMAAFVASISGALPIIMGVGAAILSYVVPAFFAWAAAAIPAAIATAAALAPVVLPLLAIGAAVALLTLAWQNNWGGIQEKTAAVWAFLQPTFDQLVTWLSAALPIAVAALAQLWTGTLWPALQTVGAFIMGTVVPALTQAATWLGTHIPIAIQAAVIGFQMVSTGAQAVWAAITSAWQNVVTTTTTAWATVTTAVQTGISVISTIVQAGWNTVVFVTSAAWNAIAGIVGPAVAQVVAVISPGIALIQSVWSAGWTVVQSVTSVAWAVIQGAVTASVGAVQGAIQVVIGFIQSVWGGAQQAAQAQTSAAWTAIQTLITGAMLAIKLAITAGIAIVKTVMSTAWAVVVAAAQNDFGKIPGIIQAGWERVKAIFNTAIGMLKSMAGLMASAAMALGKNIVSGIISGVSSMASALSDKIKGMANSALNAAKSALGIKSPSTVMAAQVGVPIVDGIVAGLGAASPKLTTKMLELAGGMVDLVSKGVDAFGKLRDLGSISFGAIEQFTNTMQSAMTLFANMALQWDKAMMSAASQFSRKAGEITDAMIKGVEFLLKLQDFEGVAPAVITAFADNLAQAMTELVRVSTRELRIGMSAAVEFSLSANKILDILGKGVDGLIKLGTLAAPVQGSFQNFATQVLYLVFRMTEVANALDASAVAAAGRFAEGAGKVLGILGSGVDGLIKLGTLGAPVQGSFQNFANQVLWLVLRISEVSNLISVDAVARAAAFSEGAGKVIGLIGSGVEGFTKLATFKGIAAAPIELFAQAVAGIVIVISRLTAFIAADAVKAAGVFAEGAGKVVAILGSGVDGFTKLTDFGPVSTIAMDYFANAIANIVNRMVETSHWFDAEGVAAAAIFAEGAGKVLGTIKGGVDGLLALKDLGPVSQAGLDAFAVAIGQLMTRLTAIAVQFSIESVQAAGAFSDAAGKAVGILKNGIEGLLLLNTFTGTSVEAMTRFGDGVRLAVAKMAQLALEFGTDAIAAATAFANAAGQSTDFLKKGVEGFLKLAEFQAIPQEAMNLFAQGVVSLVNTIIGLSSILSVETLAAANTFSNAIDTVITVVLSGLKALSDLGSKAAGLQSFTDALVATVNQVAAALVNQARPAAQNIGLAISYGIADGIAAGAGAIQNSIFAAVNAALAAARAALGIASPSKVFADQIGAQMSAGMAAGVMGGMPQVQGAVGMVSAGALSAGQGGITNNNQRSIIFEAGSIVLGGGGGGGNIYAQADVLVNEIQRRLSMQGA